MIKIATRKYFKVGLLSFIIFFLISIVGGYLGHAYKFLGAAMVYCLTTFLLLRRTSILSEKLVTICILGLPIIILDLPLRIFEFEDTLFSFPSSVAQLIGILFGYLIFISHRPIRWALILFLFFGSLWVTFKGYAFWLNKIDFGSFNGFVMEHGPLFEFKTFDGKSFTNSALKNSITIFDFWNTGCGVCYKKFPILQQKFDKCKSDTSIKIFAVNIPLKRDTIGQVEKFMEERGYTFSNLLAENSMVKESFKIKVFPTTLIVDQNNNILYRGNIENIDSVISKIKTDQR